jgi:AraC-like DNA-binding protein
MSTTELVMRIAAFTELSLLIPILLLRGGKNRSYRPAGLLLLGLAAYFLAPVVLNQWQWGWASYPVILLAIVVPVLFWYFVRATFSEDPAVHPTVKWLAIATAGIGFLGFFTRIGGDLPGGQPLSPYLIQIAQIAKLMWLAAAFVELLKDWRADLVESRRRLRRLIVLAGGCYIVVILIIELFVRDQVPASLELFHVALLLLAVTALCVHMLNLGETNILARMATPDVQQNSTRSTLAEQVLTMMEQDRAFASDALTIKSLADLLRTQPSQLRAVINGELGYRNFNAFINRYRIQEVAQRLTQEEYRNTPLLTLALDAGFRSLAPFNRSFKDHYKVTPSEYRRKIRIQDN